MTALLSEIPLRTVTQQSTRRLRVIYNPIAGQRHGERLRKTFRALEQSGASVSVIETNGPGDAERAAASACCADTDILIAAGGDGTINEVVNGLMAAPGQVPPLGVLPLGPAKRLAPGNG